MSNFPHSHHTVFITKIDCHSMKVSEHFLRYLWIRPPAGRSRDRMPVAARFSAQVHTGPGAQPASYTMGTWSLLGVKRPGRGIDHQSHLVPKLKKKPSSFKHAAWSKLSILCFWRDCILYVHSSDTYCLYEADTLNCLYEADTPPYCL